MKQTLLAISFLLLMASMPVEVQAQTLGWASPPYQQGALPIHASSGTPTVHEAMPHPVLRSPGAVQGSKQHHLGHKIVQKYTNTYPPHTSHRQRMAPTAATIPQASEQPRWKTPYSYGYFGAQPKPSWSKHHGYRDNYTQWTRH